MTLEKKVPANGSVLRVPIITAYTWVSDFNLAKPFLIFGSRL